MPGQVRCHHCGDLWPGGSRFCGRCGAVLGEAASGVGTVPEVARTRRRLVATLALLVGVLVLLGIVFTGGDPDAPPDVPPDVPPGVPFEDPSLGAPTSHLPSPSAPAAEVVAAQAEWTSARG